MISRLGTKIVAFREDRSGLALIEFAYSLPILMAVTLLGAETANLAMTNLRVSQTALQVADNASRIGEASVLQNRKIYEEDINDIFVGAGLLAGKLDIYKHGRIIVSSLEQNSSGGQWIHWQRCMGTKNVASAYGAEGKGQTGTAFKGFQYKDQLITAPAGEAVIFVEIQYDYQPIFSTPIGTDKVLGTVAVFNVRDARDLTQLYERKAGVAKATCGKYQTKP